MSIRSDSEGSEMTPLSFAKLALPQLTNINLNIYTGPDPVVGEELGE